MDYITPVAIIANASSSTRELFADVLAESRSNFNPFRTWWDLGYRSIIPIVPPGAPLYDRSVLNKKLKAGHDARGKAPGIRSDDGLWMGLRDWQTHQTTEADIDAWNAMGAGVGLPDDGGLVLLDIDATDEATADRVEADAVALLGPAPMRVGSWPKRALIYRIDETLPFMMVDFQNGEEKNRVEILARPKQLVVHGVHPKTGKPYEWRRPIVPRDQLTLVTREAVEAFLEVQREKLPQARTHASTLPTDRAAIDQDHLKGEIDLVRQAVAAIPNTEELFPHYDDMVRVGLAIHAATADHPEDGFDIYDEWASRWPGSGYSYERTVRDWGTFRAPHAVGAEFLYSKASRHGGTDGAEVRQRHLCAKWFDADLAAAAQAPLAGDNGLGAEPRAPLVVDIFGHGDPGDLGTPPAGSLPPVLLAWARTEARRKGVSEAFAAASAVAVAGSAIGASLMLQVKQLDTGWKEPASLWVTLIAPPGSAKSAIISAAAEPLKKLDAEYRREWAPRHAAWEKADKAARKSRKDPPVADAGSEPICPRVVLDSFTAEKIIRVFAENPRGVMCTPDELSGLLGSFGAYKASGDGDRGMFLRFFDGGDVKSDRVGGGTISAESALLGILASSQPDKIRKMADNLGGDGLLQRCLFIMHDGRDRAGLDEAPDEKACSLYAYIVRGLARAEYRFPDPIRLSAEAAVVRSEGLAKLRSLQWIFGASAPFEGHVAKYDKFLARLILIFHCVDEFGRHGVVDPEVRVSPATVSMAVEFAGFLMRHSLEFYREFVGASDIVEDVQWVAGFLLAHPERTSVSKRDLYNVQRRFAGTSGHKLCIATMSELETAGWVQAKDRKSAADKDVWNVNPAIHVLFAEHAKREKRRRLESQERIKQAGAARRWASGAESGDDAVVAPVAASAFN